MEEIDLSELLKVFWNKRMKILIITLAIMLIGLVYKIFFVTPMYSASTTLILASSNKSTTLQEAGITTTDITINSKLISTYSELIKSNSIIRTVKDNLHIDIDEAELKKNIKVTAVKDTELIEITVANENAKNATIIANEIAEVFIDKVKSIYKIENVQVVDKAEEKNSPSNVNYKKDLLIFGLIGLVISFAYVFVENLLDNTIKTEEEIEKLYQLPTLAAIPVHEDEQKLKKGGRR